MWWQRVPYLHCQDTETVRTITCSLRTWHNHVIIIDCDSERWQGQLVPAPEGRVTRRPTFIKVSSLSTASNSLSALWYNDIWLVHLPLLVSVNLRPSLVIFLLQIFYLLQHNEQSAIKRLKPQQNKLINIRYLGLHSSDEYSSIIYSVFIQTPKKLTQMLSAM